MASEIDIDITTDQIPFLKDIFVGPLSSIYGNPTTYCYFTGHSVSMDTCCNINQVGAGK